MESLAQASSTETEALVNAYYQGIADYINALTSNE
jgi:acyl-homoserine lactone acylase PvdQ